MAQFCGFLRAAGYPIARSTVIIPTLHPQIFATVLVWRDDVADVRVVFEPHDILLQPRFADSPFAPIIRGAGGVRRHLEDDDVKLDFPDRPRPAGSMARPTTWRCRSASPTARSTSSP